MEKFKYTLSVIIPFLNEKESLPVLIRKLTDAVDQFSSRSEIIFINDGSSDSGAEVVKAAAVKDSRIKLISFKRNYGQTAAWAAGIEHAKGDLITFLDADLQNDPADIAALTKKLDEGFDVVSGWRKNRKDSLFTRKIPSQIANWLISKVTGVSLHDYGCSLKLYKAEILRNVKLYGEMHRFLPAYAAWEGARIAEIPVQHFERTQGVSKYGLNRIYKVFLDLITTTFLGGFATKPLYFFGFLGLIALFGGLATFSVVAYRVLILERKEATPMIFMMVVFFLSFIQFTLMGLIAEISTRIYYEGRAQKTYRVKETVNF